MDRAKQILLTENEGGFKIDEGNLNSILLEDEQLRDKPVVLISVAGAFRKGKSFLLDMMLRYLTAPDKINWLNWRDTGSSGFPWQCGYRRHTTGILMWSRLFPVTLPTGEEAVILLMDTQGTFDNHSTIHESSVVFALSTLLSSLQIFNLMGNLQSDDLENLQLFTEYGRMALDESSNKPFQKLLFLIRDWQHIDDLPLGEKGGRDLVEEWLESKNGKKELMKVRKHIRSCFTEIEGFLLPHPGQKVAGSSKFDGAAEDMDPQFAEGLKKLMPMILSPEKLTIKTIAGNSLKARDLASFMNTYVTLFRSDQIPKPKNILAATAEANNMAAAHDAKTLYIQTMETLLGEEKPSFEASVLFNEHQKAARDAENAFKTRKKMGDRKTVEQFLVNLIKEMDEWFKFAERANNTKREKECLAAEKCNLELTGRCKESYIEEMKVVAGEGVGYVSPQDMDQAHTIARENAFTEYDAEKIEFGNISQLNRYHLAETIDAEFKKMLFHNDVKKDAKNQKAAQVNMKAVGEAKKSYQSMMNTLTKSQVLSDEQLQNRHCDALQTAVEMYTSNKEGDEGVCLAYLETLRSDLDRELTTYIRSNMNKLELQKMQKKIVGLQQDLEETKKQKKRCVIQ